MPRRPPAFWLALLAGAAAQRDRHAPASYTACELSCDGGSCAYRHCDGVVCRGGACTFEDCTRPECDGGACTFVRCAEPSCRGGGCEFEDTTTTLGYGFCDGGNCRVQGKAWPGKIAGVLSF
jgi:hypothetical protein